MLGEASEIDYWLEIIETLNWGDNTILSGLRKEAKELLAIFTQKEFLDAQRRGFR
ncbi:four helix bundle protein [Snuella sedimenti]|uniref:Four helix bundle protein n=1 Tax=Snuella sedimenti TaxID=2798802 RepID=A0A8J7IFI1_9FLAO|nr:hypothetical protein [Snuella sedimenti]MBJ6367877.1 hypothetical protein [Snuella sedimenti]